MTRGTTLVASASNQISLATQQSTVVMPTCLLTEHESGCAYLRVQSKTHVQTTAQE
jgi:hypothetical protein